MDKLDIIAVAGIHPFYRSALDARFNVHAAPRLDSSVDELASFSAIAERVVGVACGGESVISRSLISQLPALKVVSVFGVGYDGVDWQTARERGVQVAHTPGVLTEDVADLAMSLVLSVARGVVRADSHVRAGKWPQGGIALGTKVSGARMGLVGLGRIGSAIARRAKAFDMVVSYHARSEKPDSGCTYYADVIELARHVDFLVLTTPGGAQTKHMINAGVLSALGANGYLINVARGSVVDQEALVHALSTGVIAGAGLDVFDKEPQVPEALWGMSHVVLTPHIASGTVQTRRAMADLAFSNMVAGTAGKPVATHIPDFAIAT